MRLISYRTLSDLGFVILALGAGLFFQAELMSVQNVEIFSIWVLIIPILAYTVLRLLSYIFKSQILISVLAFNLLLFCILPVQLFNFYGLKIAILGILIPIILVIVFFILRKKIQWKLTAIGMLSFAFISLTFSVLSYQLVVVQIRNERKMIQDETGSGGLKAEIKPNIYFILLDAQTSFESLYKYWNYQDSSILKRYIDLGFKNISGARSVYDKTPLSMASTLNLSKLHVDEELPENEYFRKVIPSIKNATIFNILNKEGYDIYNYSIFDIPGKEAFYNYGVQSRYSSFGKVMLNNNTLSIILEKLKVTGNKEKLYASLDASHQEVLNKLGEMVTRAPEKPSFVYAHLMLPHHPYFKSRSGKLITSLDSIFPSSTDLKKQMYIGQFEYVHRQLIDIFRQADNNKPYVVIIQGDHGFRELDDYEDNLNERHTIMYLVKTNDLAPLEMDSARLNVNTFRVLLNNYFNASLKYYN